MDFFGLGWRDGLLLAAGIIAVYLVISLLHLAKLRRRRQVAEPVAPAFIPPPVSPLPEISPEPMDLVPPAPPMPSPSPFAEQLARTGLESEVTRLRAEVAALRDEIAELRASPSVSPLYAEAMALARRGYNAQGIADECGISVAEAELVTAMSRDGKSLNDEVNHGGN